ncbi:MAG: hypothetical protein U1F34_05540 [Gammaproteobacteria bacterium]
MTTMVIVGAIVAQFNSEQFGRSGYGPGNGGGGALGNTDEAPVPQAVVMLDHDGQVYKLSDDLTADGTAVAVTADDVTLDLNGHTITYNAAPSDQPVYGVYVAIGIDRVTIKNGYILQGAGKSKASPAIYLYGASWQVGPHELHDLVIRTQGFQSDGIQADKGYGFNGSKIYRSYIEVRGGTDAVDGEGGDCIMISAENRGGVEIHDNILVGGHRGMQLVDLGAEESNRSDIFGNRIQHHRSLGSKAPYGILLAGRSHNVQIRDNQIVSDDGRGINIDGWGQDVPEGASGNTISNNRIDVQYSSVARSGEYVENNVYGIRDRYSSGDNIFENNVVTIGSDISGEVFGFYIGSDDPDPLMRNITVRGNTVIARQGPDRSSESVAFQFGAAQSVAVSGNRYLASKLVDGEDQVKDLKMSDNVTLARDSNVQAVSDLKLTRFGNSYLLEWKAHVTAGTQEYVVRRDGKRLPISPRGGTFYVDIDVVGEHRYEVSSVSMEGVEGPRSVAVTTDKATKAWW